MQSFFKFTVYLNPEDYKSSKKAFERVVCSDSDIPSEISKLCDTFYSYFSSKCVIVVESQNVPNMKFKNNPLNIRYNHIRWAGLSGHRSGFCEFDELYFGLRAGLFLMSTYRKKYHLESVESIIARFAPSSENDTESYINFVCKKANLKRNERLISDLQYCRLLSAMCLFESSFHVSADYIQFIMNFYSIRIVS